MDKYDSSPIATILEATGFSSEIWPVNLPLQAPDDGTVAYTLGTSHRDDSNDFSKYCNQIQLHDRTISTLQSLPAAYVLGHGVLVRTEPNFTAMVSIAEATHPLLGKAYSGSVMDTPGIYWTGAQSTRSR